MRDEMVPSEPPPPKIVANAYAPPRASAPRRAGASNMRLGVSAIAIGIVLTLAWNLYAELRVGGAVSGQWWMRTGGVLLLWSVPTGLMLAGMDWARKACRVLCVFMAITPYLIRPSGASAWLDVAISLRALTFGVAMLALRRPKPPAGTNV